MVLSPDPRRSRAQGAMALEGSGLEDAHKDAHLHAVRPGPSSSSTAPQAPVMTTTQAAAAEEALAAAALWCA